MLQRLTPAPDPLDLLGDRLVGEGVVDAAALARARRVAQETDQRLDVALCRLGLVGESEMADALAGVLGLERAAASEFPNEPPCVEALGARFLTSARALPLSDGPEGVRLALADPFDLSVAEAAALKLKRRVTACVAAPSEIEAALERLGAAEEPDGLSALVVGDGDAAEDVARLRDLASEAPVVRIVNQMIRKAVEARASDIHLEPFEKSLRVRLRVDGALREVEAPPSHLRAAVVSRVKIMAGLNIAEQRLPQDGRIQIVVAGRDVDLRVATSPTLHGEAVVMRLLDRSGLVLDFAGLGFDAAATAEIERLIALPNGIVLVTGPTGSGKTTTLYAAVSKLNSPERKIITVEDPVEYQLPGVAQIQVKSQIGLTFARGLRSILRQDPDVVMIGEIRDVETAEIAVQAALTGHLVLATLHTNSAAAAVSRLRDMGVEDYLLTATLAGVVAQRLVRRLCPDCAAPGETALAERLAPDVAPERFRVPVGCGKCQGGGYRGRTSVVEVLTMDDALRRAVHDRREQREIEALAVGAGMRSLRAHGVEKAAAGETSLAEVLRVAAEG